MANKKTILILTILITSTISLGCIDYTKSTITNPLYTFTNLHDANDQIPTGTIVLWYGDINHIPTKYHLCDGTNGTPDLRNKFIVGASNDQNGTADTNLTGTLTKTGGDVNHTHRTQDHTHSLAGQNQTVSGAAATFVGTTSSTDSIMNVYQSGAGIAVYARKSVTASGGSTTTLGTSTVPVPYYALAYIMKIQN